MELNDGALTRLRVILGGVIDTEHAPTRVVFRDGSEVVIPDVRFDATCVENMCNDSKSLTMETKDDRIVRFSIDAIAYWEVI